MVKNKMILQDRNVPKVPFKILESIGGENKPKQIKVRSLFQEQNVVNRNGRIYPLEQVKMGVEQVREKMVNRQLMGELDHPESPEQDRFQYVELKSVSHLITNLELDGYKLWGEFETLPTPNGIILRNLIEQGVSLGVSLRQFGDVTERLVESEIYYEIVPETYELRTFDIVSEPGFKSQMFNTQVKEGLQESLDFKLYDNKLEKFVYERLYFHLKNQLK